jgi:peptidyl-prolyl cis-trans isomerase B (cyclophilin B)
MKTKIAITLTLLTSLFVFSACAEQAKAPAPQQNGAITSEAAKNTETQQFLTSTQEMKPSTPSATQTTASIKTPQENQLAPPAAGEKIAVIETDFGTIKIKLFSELVPGMTKNFIELSKAGKYNNVPFHRVVQDFMIQTGDFTKKNGTGGYSYKGPGTELPDEITPALRHLYGTVSMANHGSNTNGSQFFIVTNKNGTSFLDGSYTIFGQVYEGMDVAEKIAALQVPGTEAPSKIINIKKITILTYGS